MSLSRCRFTTISAFALAGALSLAACGGNGPSTAKSSQTPPPQETATVTEPAAQPVESAAADGAGMVRIFWRLQSQENNYGFYIYRGESAEGPFVQANEEILPGHGTSAAPHTYEYFDTGLDIGKRYWYYVESVSYDGVREKMIDKPASIEAKPRQYYVEKGHNPPAAPQD